MKLLKGLGVFSGFHGALLASIVVKNINKRGVGKAGRGYTDKNY